MNERKELIARLRLDYTASKLALSLMQQAADMLEADSEPKCSEHPDAPHGFSRNASHSVGRYVCECEGWIPDALAVRKQALGEAYKWMLDRHEAQKHRDNYMLIEANRFKKELLTLPRVEQGSIPKQVKPHSSGEVVGTVAWDVVQAKDQPS